MAQPWAESGEVSVKDNSYTVDTRIDTLRKCLSVYKKRRNTKNWWGGGHVNMKILNHDVQHG